MDLKEYIKSLIRKQLEEMSTTASVGGYSTPFIFSPNPNKALKNAATKYAIKMGWKLAKKPTTSKIVDYKKIFEMNEAKPMMKPKNGGRRFIIMPFFELPDDMFKPYKIKEGETIKLFKIVTSQNTGEKVLLIHDLARIALESIERGRTSFEKEQRLPIVTQIIKEKIPGNIRGIIKKAVTGLKTLENGYAPVPIEITNKTSSAVKYNLIQLKEKGISLLRKFKENPQLAEPFGSAFSKVLIYLYKNRENQLSVEDIADSVGIAPIAASRIANQMQKEDIITMTEPKSGGSSSDKWYILNPAVNPEDAIKQDLQTKLYENIKNIVDQELLNEVTYSKFKKDVKHRTKSEQLHKAIREVKRKLMEIDRIVEYTSRMKQELSEDEGGISYWKATQNNIGRISEMVNQLNNKIKNLHQ